MCFFGDVKPIPQLSGPGSPGGALVVMWPRILTGTVMISSDLCLELVVSIGMSWGDPQSSSISRWDFPI